MKRILLVIYTYLKRFVKIYLFRDKFEREVRSWIRNKGDLTLRLDYPLEEASIVFDCGGYEGEWAHLIHARYQSNIYIFEPVDCFYSKIKERFDNIERIKVFQFGLHSKNESTIIYLDNDASSVFKSSGSEKYIELVDISEFVNKHQIEFINLIKINIEGGEYDLLDRIIDSGMINKIENLQVQFHNFVSNAIERRDGIRSKLKMTHRLTYDYPFVWENWQKISKG